MPKTRLTLTDELLQELTKTGIKYNPEEVLQIAKTPDGKIVFLEIGKSRTVTPKPSGLTHILEAHGDDFVRSGIPRDQIQNTVMEAVTHGNIVGQQGTRPIYEVVINGQTLRIAVTVGNNGYIVGANPVSLPK